MIWVRMWHLIWWRAHCGADLGDSFAWLWVARVMNEHVGKQNNNHIGGRDVITKQRWRTWCCSRFFRQFNLVEQKRTKGQEVVVLAFKPSTWEAEASRSRWVLSAWSTKRVLGQPRLHRVTMRKEKISFSGIKVFFERSLLYWVFSPCFLIPKLSKYSGVLKKTNMP